MPEPDEERFNQLVARLRSAGADDPESWARSEISEDIAQSARFAFLRAVWRDLDRWRDPAFRETYLEGITLDETTLPHVSAVLARVAFDVAFDVVMQIDHEEDVEADEGLPGWRLMELDQECELTGREVGGLHESFLDVDPLGIEAEDIRGS